MPGPALSSKLQLQLFQAPSRLQSLGQLRSANVTSAHTARHSSPQLAVCTSHAPSEPLTQPSALQVQLHAFGIYQLLSNAILGALLFCFVCVDSCKANSMEPGSPRQPKTFLRGVSVLLRSTVLRALFCGTLYCSGPLLNPNLVKLTRSRPHYDPIREPGNKPCRRNIQVDSHTCLPRTQEAFRVYVLAPSVA